MRAKFVPKEIFVPPSENVSPSTNCAPKESNRTDATEEHFQTRLLFFLVFLPNVRANSTSKEVFCAPKVKIVPDKKATGLTPRRCICAIDLFFGLHPRICFFAPTKFSMPPFSSAHYSGTGSASMN